MTPAEQTRHTTRADLRAALRAARTTLRARIDDLTDAQWQMPQQPGANLIAWEAAHVAWFAENWIRRGPHRLGDDGLVYAAQPPRIAGPDALLDSARLAHADRWRTPLPPRAAVEAMLDAQLADTLAALDELPDDADATLYAHRLALAHEDMHAEAFAWLRGTLGYPAPSGVALSAVPTAPPVVCAGGRLRLGFRSDEPGFHFDNECEGPEVELAPFQIDTAPVNAGRYAEFVEAGGYTRAEFWPGAAGQWRSAGGATHPARWRRAAGGGWELRWFDRWQPLDPAQPVVHVNAFEAEAFCRWAQRRLPRAAEWEYAARQEPAFLWGGTVWEWMADDFLPYPGFVPHRYHDYSKPWFGNHRELRGGSCAAPARLQHPRFRNFFTPERTDVFAGFRTAR
jgi:ergothioneine biosynthesis protein EgtB